MISTVNSNSANEDITTATRNPCRMCTPLGATMVFAGIANAVPFLHGSQGCSTYIRRYLISHFREPVDIACSNFGEASVIFGGWNNLHTGINSVIEQYNPALIGIGTTCLAETIGEDLPQMIHRMEKLLPTDNPVLVSVSTPSYQGSHTDGFHRTVRAVVQKLAQSGPTGSHINLFSGMISPAEIRHLKNIVDNYNLQTTLLPDYSDALDNGIWNNYEKNIESGTSIDSIRQCAQAKATIEFRIPGISSDSAGELLLNDYNVPLYTMPAPIGIELSDEFFAIINELTGLTTPEPYAGQRSRLIDSYIDGHKYLFGKKAILYGPSDMVASLAVFLSEIGVLPVLCAAGDNRGRLEDYLNIKLPHSEEKITIIEDTDFATIQQYAASLDPDIIIGDSNGYKMARSMGLPLIRVGLPVHDRIGAARIETLGYQGTQQLFDRIVNAILEKQQHDSPVGYTHL